MVTFIYYKDKNIRKKKKKRYLILRNIFSSNGFDYNTIRSWRNLLYESVHYVCFFMI